MASKDNDDFSVGSADAFKNLSGNADLIPGAGKVFIDPAQSWGKGFIKEFKSTIGTHWISEMTNFNQKTVAVSLLMFISVIAPALAFGAVYSRNTENNIGAVESVSTILTIVLLRLGVVR